MLFSKVLRDLQTGELFPAEYTSLGKGLGDPKRVELHMETADRVGRSRDEVEFGRLTPGGWFIPDKEFRAASAEFPDQF